MGEVLAVSVHFVQFLRSFDVKLLEIPLEVSKGREADLVILLDGILDLIVKMEHLVLEG
jgi:hypothetical protein